MPTDKETTLAEAIAHFEGFYLTEEEARRQNRHWPTIPQRLNNPGDLVFRDQPFSTDGPVTGFDGVVRHYAKFDTVEHGWEALYRQIELDAGRGLTLWQFVNKYAPAADANNPNEYFAFVAHKLDAKPTDLLSAVIA